MNDPHNPSQPQQTGVAHVVHPQPPRQVIHPAQPIGHSAPAQSPRSGITIGNANVPSAGHSATEEELAPLSLIEDDSAAAQTAAGPKKIRAFGPEFAQKQRHWKRPTHVTGTGVCRLKSFHGKYSDQGLEYLDDVINEWLDAHPEVEVKFVTSTVAVFEGKIREPALVLNLWY